MVKRATEGSMYCRQCQETYGNSACTIAGVCGKRAITAGLMDELVARLEDLAAEKKPTSELGRFVTGALFMTLTNTNFDDERLKQAIVEAERLLGRKPLNKKPKVFAEENVDLRSLKELCFLDSREFPLIAITRRCWDTKTSESMISFYSRYANSSVALQSKN